ncbi:MAG TPA: GntR family transcriptional regulator [Candidatus Acidoferrum sp.]|nr:GntR family transcriptional regulator [Candidatus Acidoferrum sp.]
MSEKALPLPPSRQTLTDSVYDAVMELVMDQHIEAGARVNIDMVARQLNVSPTPVREALARLEMDGLVVKEPLRGYSVTPMLDTKNFNDLYDVRRLLEPFAARRAAERHDEKVLRVLDRELAEMRRSGGTSSRSDTGTYQDYSAFALQDARFHEAIAGTSGNALLSDTLRRLRSHLRLYRLYHQYYTRAIGAATVIEHESILDAIRAGDAGGAEAAMLDHIDRSRDRSEGARLRSGNRPS